MRNTLLFLCTVFFGILSAQNTPPVVENVNFFQRTDGSQIVDITYDVSDAEGDLLTITVEASDSGRNIWNITFITISHCVQLL